MPIIDERIKQEAEAAAAKEAAEKASKEAEAKAAEEAAKAKELEGMPEAFRGKSTKELVDMALAQAAEVERAKREAEELRAKVPKPAAEQLTPEQRKAELERQFFADPINFLDQHVFNRVKPLAEATIATQVAAQKELARREINKEEGPGEFEKREKRIDEIMDSMPPEVKVNPAAWIGVYNLVEGEEARKVRKEAKAKAGLHSETGGSPATGGGEKKLPKSLEDLDTAAIERAAAKFGMTKDAYIEWAEKYEG